MRHDVTTTINWPEWLVYGWSSGRPVRLTSTHERGRVSDLELLVLDIGPEPLAFRA